VTAEREQWGHDPGRNSGGGVVGGGCFSGGCATTGASYPTQCNDGPTPNQKYNSLIKAADDGGYESQKELCNYPHTLTKYCVLAAAQGNRAASYVAGQNYYNGVDVQKNYTEAYFWLTVATRDTQCLGTADINLANKNLSDIQKTLSADEVSDIQKRVDDWKTAHPFNKGCE
jgi:hypothetical protein